MSDLDLRKIQFFINFGVDVNTRDGEALATAIENYFLNATRLLLENRAIITDTVKEAFIGEHCCPEMWELLYEFGIEPHNIVTPDILLNEEQLYVIRLMYKNGIDIYSIMDKIKDH
jgi:hypothetical protein